MSPEMMREFQRKMDELRRIMEESPGRLYPPGHTEGLEGLEILRPKKEPKKKAEGLSFSPQKCGCGAASCGTKSFHKGHSPWCDVHESKGTPAP